jgi:raffinose synthase
VGRPTRDCLFADVTREPVLLKVFNINRHGAVVGAFNAHYHPDAAARKVLEGTVSPVDVPGLQGEEFAGYFHQARRVWHGPREAREAITLAEGQWEIVTYVPVDRGVAMLGLADNTTAGPR